MSDEVKVSKPVRIFYSYSHKDWQHTLTLKKHLSLLQRRGIIEIWHDREIRPGDEWKGEIDRHLAEADIILLLVSADFLASDYCYEVEMKNAINRHEAGKARVVPVIIRPCDWHAAPFGKLQALPAEGKAIDTWNNPDEGYTDVAIGIRKIVEEISAGPVIFTEAFRDKKTELYGLRDNLGRILIPAKYDEIDEQETKLIKVRKRNLWGLFDRSGQEILPIRFDEISLFWEQNDLLEVSAGKRSGLVHISGKWVVPLGKYDDLGGFCGEFVTVGQNGKYGLMKYGKYVIPMIYDRIGARSGNRL
jgi:hypothetical protein